MNNRTIFFMQDASTNYSERPQPFDDDMAMSAYVPKILLGIEVELFTKKWFDYRFITPFQATRLFIAEYDEIYREMYKKYINRECAEYVTVADLDKIMDGLRQAHQGALDDKAARKVKSKFTALWKARQAADLLGVPYNFFIRAAIEARMKFWNQKFLPTPSHLYSERVLDDVRQVWADQQQGRLILSEHPNYQGEFYVNSQAQNDYHEWLITQAYALNSPAEYLTRFIKERLLPISKVKDRVQNFIWTAIETNLIDFMEYDNV